MPEPMPPGDEIQELLDDWHLARIAKANSLGAKRAITVTFEEAVEGLQALRKRPTWNEVEHAIYETFHRDVCGNDLDRAMARNRSLVAIRALQKRKEAECPKT